MVEEKHLYGDAAEPEELANEDGFMRVLTNSRPPLSLKASLLAEKCSAKAADTLAS